MIGVTIFIVALLIIAVWVIIEVKRMRHKMFAIFLVVLILFSYFSVSFVFKGKDIDYTSISGVSDAAKIYLSWLGSAFKNLKTITSEAINMEWAGNETSG